MSEWHPQHPRTMRKKRRTAMARSDAFVLDSLYNAQSMASGDAIMTEGLCPNPPCPSSRISNATNPFIAYVGWRVRSSIINIMLPSTKSRWD
jgi:hypothetical protein